MAPVRVRSVLVAAVVVAAAALAWTRLGRDSGPPSVLLVTLDTTRADRLGCYGRADAGTPTLDGLAAEGALFEDAASSSPVTLPSHATILTGLHPPRHGLRDNDPPRPLAPAAARAFRTAAEEFAAAGYETHAVVSCSALSPRWGLDAGFGGYEAPEDPEPGESLESERKAEETVDRALSFLRGRGRGRPFFLWVHLFDPHYPYRPPGGTGAAPDSEEAYQSEIAYADRELRRLLEALRAEGTLDRTVVAVAADHGEGLGEHGERTHGFFLHRSTIRVPLLLRYPPGVPAGTRVRSSVSLVDLYPTLLDLARRPLPDYPLDGRPLAPLLRGEAPAPGAEGLVQYSETLYGWRSFRWAQSVACRVGDLRAIDHGGGRRVVYDLASDPGETRDLAAARGAEAEAAVEIARGLLGKPEMLLPGTGSGPERGGSTAVGYLGAGPITVLPKGTNALQPVPSAPFLASFLAAQRNLALARTLREDDPGRALEALAAAREAFEDLGRQQPLNPAVPFWIGRSWAEEAKASEAGSRDRWMNAWRSFIKAGELGYRDGRNASLIMEALFKAQEPAALRLYGENCLKASLDGDSSYWCWIALAHLAGTEPPSAKDRAVVEDAIDRARGRARNERERKHVDEIRALLGAR